MWMNILDSRYRRRLFRLLQGVPLACAATQVAAAEPAIPARQLELDTDTQQRLIAESSTTPATPVQRRCVMNAGCFAGPRRLRYDGPVELPIYRTSLTLGAYGPVQVKFSGDRVKVRWRF